MQAKKVTKELHSQKGMAHIAILFILIVIAISVFGYAYYKHFIQYKYYKGDRTTNIERDKSHQSQQKSYVYEPNSQPQKEDYSSLYNQGGKVVEINPYTQNIVKSGDWLIYTLNDS